MVTLGMVLIFIIPILLLLLVGAQIRFESLSEVQASSAIRIIADSINEVYVEGPGASKIAVVNFPSNTKNISIHNNEVTLTLETRSGNMDITTTYFGNVSDSSPAYITTEGDRPPVGLYPLKFMADTDGRVEITQPEEG